MDEAFAHIESDDKKSKKGLVPPDGGWGYVVGIGVGFTFVSILFILFLTVKKKWFFMYGAKHYTIQDGYNFIE